MYPSYNRDDVVRGLKVLVAIVVLLTTAAFILGWSIATLVSA